MVSLMGGLYINLPPTIIQIRLFSKFDQTVKYNSMSFLSLLYISRVDAKGRDESGWQVYGLRVKSKESKFLRFSEI